MLFKDRADAERKLAEALSKHEGENAVVYALPRGGVILGYEVASHLGIPLDLIIIGKIGYPGNEECSACTIARWTYDLLSFRSFSFGSRMNQVHGQKRDAGG